MLDAKHTKRSLPTLTEVVQPYAVPEAPAVDPEQLFNAMLQRVMPAVEAQVRALLHQQIQAQLRLLKPQLEQQIAALIRKEIARALGDAANI
jgi:hypothetical protein